MQAQLPLLISDTGHLRTAADSHNQNSDNLIGCWLSVSGEFVPQEENWKLCSADELLIRQV